MQFDYPSKSGHSFSFKAYNYHGQWKYNEGGLYIFAKYNHLGHRWLFFYIGKTNSFGSRLNNHPRWDEAVRLGADIVLAIVINHDNIRSELEKELIQRYQPCLNEVYKSIDPPNLGILGGALRLNEELRTASAPRLGLGAIRFTKEHESTSQQGLGIFGAIRR
jgi:hypothetical protein